MDILLIIVLVLLLFGGGWGYSRWGTGGRIGLVGALLVALLLYLFLGHGRF